MSQNSIDQKSKSSSDNDISSFSDSEEDNSEFFSKAILFESNNSKEDNKCKSTTILPKSSNTVYEDINKSKTMTMSSNQLNKLDKSDVNICLEKDNSFNNIKDIENINTCSRNITRDSSPKKKTLSFLLLGKEKTKVQTKKISVYEKIKEKKEPEKCLRMDKNGTVINKRNKKKVKISFKTPFEDVEYIESFKSFNVVHGIPKNDVFTPQQDHCQCCQIW